MKAKKWRTSKVNEEQLIEEQELSEATLRWGVRSLTVFGLNDSDIANIQKQKKDNPDWFPTSQSGKKTYWAYVSWLSAKPKE